MRSVQKELWGEVFDVVTNITRSSEEGNAELFAAEVAHLQAIHARQDVLGQPTPFLTEALADYTENAAEAVRLYRLALAQSGAYPDEPTHTKRIWMASRLIELGELPAARTELIQGRAQAERLKDAESVAMADELLSRLSI